MRLAGFLLSLAVLGHTSAWHLDQRRQMVQDIQGRAFGVPQPHVPEQNFDTREVEQPRSLEEKQRAGAGAGLGALVSLVTGLIPGLLDIIDQEDRECQFIRGVNATVLLDNRDLNVVIFHDTKSNYAGLEGAICFDQDLPLPMNFGSKTYKICAFETGTFIRSGDGGCRNWGFGACYKRTNDRTVSFCRREASPTPTTAPVEETTPPVITTTDVAPTPTTTAVPQTTREVSDSCPSGEIFCATGCIPDNAVCCPGGGYCNQGYICTSDNKCRANSGSYSGSGGGGSGGSGGTSCDTGTVSCDSSFCIPAGSNCCGLGGGKYCGPGYYCFGTGCCENGKTCVDSAGGGNPGDAVTVTLQAADGGSLGPTTVTQEVIGPVLQPSTRTSRSESMPTMAPGLAVPACLGVGVAAVVALMG